MSSDIDFASDVGNADTADLAEIQGMIREMADLETRIKDVKQFLKDLEEKRSLIESVSLPNAMDALQIPMVGLPDGRVCRVNAVIKANLPSKTAVDKARGDAGEELRARLEAGLAWLRSNDAEGMIKNQVVADMGKGEDEKAYQLLNLASELNVACSRHETVHPQTLSAFVREKIEAGEDIPMDTFAVYTGRIAKITAK